MTTTTAMTINRTPFRKVFDIPAHLLVSDRLKWESTQGTVALTTDGTRFAHVNDGKLGYWWTTKDAEFRPLGMTWEAAEALVNPPQQSKAEEPFRPGLPPAELRAVCKEWEWRGRKDRADTRFDGDKHWFVEFGETAMRHTVTIRDNFRPLGRTWADVEAAAKAVSPPPSSRLPKDGDVITVASAVAVVKEGCRQALDEAATRRQLGKVGNYAHVTYVNPWPPRTFIVASPPGRRKYVKLLLKRLGYRNVDKIPTTDKQTPFDLGRSLPDHEREDLLAIAPGIVLRDVL